MKRTHDGVISVSGGIRCDSSSYSSLKQRNEVQVEGHTDNLDFEDFLERQHESAWDNMSAMEDGNERSITFNNFFLSDYNNELHRNTGRHLVLNLRAIRRSTHFGHSRPHLSPFPWACLQTLVARAQMDKARPHVAQHRGLGCHLFFPCSLASQNYYWSSFRVHTCHEIANSSCKSSSSPSQISSRPYSLSLSYFLQK